MDGSPEFDLAAAAAAAAAACGATLHFSFMVLSLSFSRLLASLALVSLRSRIYITLHA